MTSPGALSLARQVELILSQIDQEVRKKNNLQSVLQSLDNTKTELLQCFQTHLGSAIAAKALVLKVQNVCLLKHQFLSRDTRLAAKPFGVLMDTSNSCNLACPGCVHSRGVKEKGLFDWKPGLVSFPRAQAFLNEYGPYGVQALLFNYGEPLLNPDTPRIVRLAKSYLVQTMISTNMAVPRFDAEAYVQSGLDYMILSIDGATQPVYERFRQKGSLEVVYRNIERLVQTKKALGKRTPILCWRYLAFAHNIHEISSALKIARRLGADEFRIDSAFDVSWDDPTLKPAKVKPHTVPFRRVAEQAMIENWNPFPDELNAISIEREFESPWSERLTEQECGLDPLKQPLQPCHWLYKNVVMDAHGRVFPCAGAPGPETNLVFTNIDEGGGRDSFNSNKHLAARKFFANGCATAFPPEKDLHCVRCQFNRANTDVDTDQVESYLMSAGRGLFNAASIPILCSWPN